MIWFFLHQEQWKNSSNIASNKRKERSHGEQDEEGGHGERRRRKGTKRRKKDKKTKAQYEEEEADMDDEPEEVDEDASMNDHEDAAEKAQDHLLAAGLEDSDAEDDMVRTLVGQRSPLASFYLTLLMLSSFQIQLSF